MLGLGGPDSPVRRDWISSTLRESGPCVCVGDRMPSGEDTVVSESWRSGRGGTNPVWKARLVTVRRDSIEGRTSAANETRETREAAGAAVRAPERSCDIGGAASSPSCTACEPMPAWPPSAANVLLGRIAPNEKDEARLPGMAMLLRIAAEAPAAEMERQSVEMVDMRLSTASDQRLRFSLPRSREILKYAATMRATMNIRGMMTATAILPVDRPCDVVGMLLTTVTPLSALVTSATAGVPELGAVYVAVNMGPAGRVAR